jgi:hypothetical protein
MATYVRGFKGATDRWIYLPAAVAIGVVVVLGFAESYFLRPFVAHTDSLTTLVHVHGALMTAWITLFIAQTTLVAVGRRDLHRQLGTLGMVLVALIFVVGVPMEIVAAKLGGHHMPGPALPALALVFALLLEFVTLACLGLSYRYRSDFHKRLMLLASITAMEAGAIRLPLALLNHSVFKTHVAIDVSLLVIIAFDSIKHRRLHPAFLWGTLFIVSMQAFSLWISDTSIWLRIAHGILRASG